MPQHRALASTVGFAAILGALLLSACSREVATLDPPEAAADASTANRATADAGSRADAAAPPEAAAPSDAPSDARAVDAAIAADAGARADASMAADVPAAADVAVAVDVAARVDVPATADVPAAVDAPVRVDVPARADAPVAVDAPVRADAPAAVDAPAPVDVPVAVDAGALPASGAALPAWDAATVAHVRAVRDRGLALGNRAGVFAKIGDSITESGSFLFDVGFSWVELGAYAGLDPTIQFFRATPLDGGTNSFNRSSLCATAGWTTDDALAGGDNSPLRRELRAIRPAWAIVMYGTNDVDRNSVAAFTANLNVIVDVTEAAGTVPVLSTIPDRYDGADKAAAALQIDAAIRGVAASRHVPLLDYWAALQGLPMHGVSADQIHPTVYVAGGSTAPAAFTPAGLQYGYNVRNLTAIEMLDRLRALP